MTFSRRLRHVVAYGGALCALTLGVIAPSAGASASSITFGEAPGAAPDWIFPYVGYQNYSSANVNQFQQLMYRPLYFFGLGDSPAYVGPLSLAAKPIMKNKNRTIVIDLKGWRFADGQVVNAESVMFFLNLYDAAPTSFASYTPGVGIPDQVASASGSGLQVVIHMKTSVNANWMLYNYLSQITPLANSWDVSAAHVAGTCATGRYGATSTVASCKAVLAYLDGLAGNTASFTSSFWQGGDDGPWKLTHFDSTGDATFQPNTTYSGPQKAQVALVKEVAFTSLSSEESALATGKLDLGYVAPSDLNVAAPAPGSVGPNLGSLNERYRLSIAAPYGFNFAQINFTSSNPEQAIFNQLYVRQALQESFNQYAVLKNVDANYGLTGFSPLPAATPPALAKRPTSAYAFNEAAARTLLTSHGWTESANVMTCTSPGTGAAECGSGIAANTPLSFSFMYVTGSPTTDATVNAMIANWAAIGVEVTPSANTFNNLANECTPNSGTQWSLCWSGEGWTYAPNYYPSGEQLFLTNASSNWGGYHDPVMDDLIRHDIYANAPLGPYEQFAADQLPVIYMPTLETTNETLRSLKSSIGWAPNALGNFLPEYFHF